MQKTITRWAIHKIGTEQFGYLCSFKKDAEDMLRDLNTNNYTMVDKEKSKYRVVEVKVSWEE